MKLKYAFLLISLIIILFSINAISAEDSAQDSILSNIDSYGDCNLIENSLNSNNGMEDSFKADENNLDEGYVIYVGQNDNDGDGSKENPFSTLKLACDNVSGQGKDKVTVKISEGTYELGYYLKFDTNNLVIMGIDDNVIITNKYSEFPQKVQVDTIFGPTEAYEHVEHGEAFGLTSSNSNFTASNIIFDYHTHKGEEGGHSPYIDQPREEIDFSEMMGMPAGSMVLVTESVAYYFLPFYGNANSCEFYNCSFLAGENQFDTAKYPKFVNCYFEMEDTAISAMFLTGIDRYITDDNYPIFEYCEFNITNFNCLNTIVEPAVLYYENMWFGENNIETYVHPPHSYVLTGIGGGYDDSYTIPLNRYAVFSVTQNYLGNNQFEILGKLTWNGTVDQEGMENFRPMTVQLSSTTGTVDATAILENGNFKATYTRNADTDPDEKDSVKVLLGQQRETLTFRAVDIEAVVNPIVYGPEQNVALTFAQPVTGTLTISVNNKNYTVELENAETYNYIIPDLLSANTYDVNVYFVDDVEHIYGVNSTKLTVSQVTDYTFNAVIPSEVNFGQYVAVNVVLPEYATGSVTVDVGGNSQTLNAGKALYFYFTLNAGTYPVTVTYSGDANYVQPAAKTGNIVVRQVGSSVNVSDSVFVYGETISVSYSSSDAYGVSVRVLKDGVEVAKYQVNDSFINIDSLAAGEYTVEVTTLVTSNFIPTTATAKLSITKAESTILLSDKTVTYGDDVVLSVVTTNSTGDLTVSAVDANNNPVTVTVSGDTISLGKLATGVYTVTATTNVDANHIASTATARVTVNKVEVPVSENTVNVDVPAGTTTPSFDINLPDDATGKLTVTVNGKEYTSDVVKGKASVAITDLSAGDYAAVVSYSGDANYDPITKATNISIPEAVLTGKDVNMLYTSGAKYTVVLTRAGIPLAGENVTINVNGVQSVVATDDNGSASVVLALNPSTKAYKVTATYGNVSVTNKVVVKSIITAKNVKVKKTAKSLKIKVTLKK